MTYYNYIPYFEELIKINTDIKLLISVLLFSFILFLLYFFIRNMIRRWFYEKNN